MYIDSVYWYFAIPGLILSFLAQLYVKYAFNKYSKVSSGKSMTGEEAGKVIRDGERFSVAIEATQPSLGDHFDPTQNIVRLSVENISSNSISNVAIVAHEFGHVQQKFSSSLIYKIRSVMVPVTNLGTKAGYILFFIGIAISAINLAEIGLVFFSTSVLFSLITLPVELNASSRGMKLVEKYDLIDENGRSGASMVLRAAALTYVAGLLTSILNLFYYVNILNRRRN